MRKIKTQKFLESSERRFWERVQTGQPDECWVWTGYKKKYGYGLLSWRGKHTTAYRVAWELENGPIPTGKWVLHHCDNPPCCNPNHLYLGDIHQNIKDATERKRYWRGSKVRVSKLTDGDVMDILDLRSKWGLRVCQLAKLFGVCEKSIKRIINGTAWQHIPRNFQHT